MLPTSRPSITRPEVEELLRSHGITDGFALVGIRGFFKAMGDPGRNDRRVYDDALILITPSGYMTWNANVDPSKHQPGIASLKPGKYLYRVGIHGVSRPKAEQYEAFVQAGPVTVRRDGGKEETGWFGINIHKGGRSTTSSLGCQTLPPLQWPAFRALLKEQLKRHKRAVFPYLLVE